MCSVYRAYGKHFFPIIKCNKMSEISRLIDKYFDISTENYNTNLKLTLIYKTLQEFKFSGIHFDQR